MGSKIIIVGSNSGIGCALIQKLKASGAHLIGIDIQESSQQKVDLYRCLEPTNFNAIDAFAKSLDQDSIDGLVNLSGTIKSFSKVEALSMKAWDETFNINFTSCLNSCKAFTPNLKRSSSASIVNMSSGLAFLGQQNYGPYAVAKASINSLTKTLAAELAPSIRVNAIAPGAVDTNFIYQIDGSTRIDKEAYKQMVPLGTIATANEIADLILFLLSDGSSHMTGQCIHINGGAMML